MRPDMAPEDSSNYLTDPVKEAALQGGLLGIGHALPVGAGKAITGAGEAIVNKTSSMAKDVPWGSVADLGINALPVGAETRLSLHALKGIAKKIFESRAARVAGEVTKDAAPAVEEAAPTVSNPVVEAIKKRSEWAPARRKYDPFLKKYID